MHQTEKHSKGLPASRGCSISLAVSSGNAFASFFDILLSLGFTDIVNHADGEVSESWIQSRVRRHCFVDQVNMEATMHRIAPWSRSSAVFAVFAWVLRTLSLLGRRDLERQYSLAPHTPQLPVRFIHESITLKHKTEHKTPAVLIGSRLLSSGSFNSCRRSCFTALSLRQVVQGKPATATRKLLDSWILLLARSASFYRHKIWRVSFKSNTLKTSIFQISKDIVICTII